jgi:hypothetical protein
VAKKKKRVEVLKEKRKREITELRLPEDKKRGAKMMKKVLPYTPILAQED